MAKRRVKWTQLALRDLKAALDWIKSSGGDRLTAKTFGRRVKDTAGKLDLNADRGRILEECSIVECREIFLGRYRIIYHVLEKEVHVLRFVATDRDLETMLRSITS